MRILVFSFFLFFSMYYSAQDSRDIIYNMIRNYYNPPASTAQELKEPVDLKEQIEFFINQVNEKRKNNKILYVIGVYEYDSINYDYCFSISYFLNSSEYTTMLTHYFIINDNAVVLRTTSPSIVSIFSTCGIKMIEKEDVDMLINRLTPSYNGKPTVTYEPSGMTYCKNGENIKKTFYPDADDMRREMWLQRNR